MYVKIQYIEKANHINKIIAPNVIKKKKMWSNLKIFLFGNNKYRCYKNVVRGHSLFRPKWQIVFFFLFIFKSVFSTIVFHGKVLVFFFFFGIENKKNNLLWFNSVRFFFGGGDCIILLSIKIMIWYSNLSINIYLICFLESFKIQVASCEFIHPYKGTIWSRT